MTEVIGLFFTFLAALWARKQDISRYIDDPVSRSKIISATLTPEERFRRVSGNLMSFLDRYLQHRFRFFFAMFMLSLFYVSTSFVIAASVSESRLPFFGNEYTSASARLAFSMFAVSVPLVFIAGTTHNKKFPSKLVDEENKSSLEEKLNNIIARSNAKRYFLICSFIFASFVHIIYQSEVLTAYAAFSSLLPSIKNQFIKPFLLLRFKLGVTALGANLGTFGLLVTIYSFASEEMSITDYLFICVVSLCSGFFAAIALLNCDVEEDQNYEDYWRFKPKGSILGKFLFALGRPSLFVGFHCIRSPGPFSLAVAIILFNVAASRTLVPEPVVSAGSIMLACIVFFTGATSLAGAGLFSFGAIIFVGIYLFSDPAKVFSLWAAPFFLWILLPVTNSVIDVIRWYIVRRNIENYAEGKSLSGLRLIYFDALLGILGVFAYAFVAFLFWHSLISLGVIWIMMSLLM